VHLRRPLPLHSPSYKFSWSLFLAPPSQQFLEPGSQISFLPTLPVLSLFAVFPFLRSSFLVIPHTVSEPQPRFLFRVCLTPEVHSRASPFRELLYAELFPYSSHSLLCPGTFFLPAWTVPPRASLLFTFSRVRIKFFFACGMDICAPLFRFIPIGLDQALSRRSPPLRPSHCAFTPRPPSLVFLPPSRPVIPKIFLHPHIGLKPTKYVSLLLAYQPVFSVLLFLPRLTLVLL